MNSNVDGMPFADSQAAGMLREGLARMKAERRLSARQIALRLGYKQSVVLSHMASGRVSIPLDRAEQLAAALEMDAATFMKAVLKQRHPGAVALLDDGGHRQTADAHAFHLATKIEGDEALTPEHRQILSEVVRDRKPDERWLKISEVAAVRRLRELRPTGLDEIDIHLIELALEGRALNAAD